jgi:hypothetical protein
MAFASRNKNVSGPPNAMKKLTPPFRLKLDIFPTLKKRICQFCFKAKVIPKRTKCTVTVVAQIKDHGERSISII